MMKQRHLLIVMVIIIITQMIHAQVTNESSSSTMTTTQLDPNATTTTTSSPPVTSTSTTSTTTTTTTTQTTLPTNSSTTTSTSTTTSSTTTTVTLPTRGASTVPVQKTALPHGQVRIEPASPLVRAEEIRVLADAYLRQQKPFILPVGDLPQNWNFSTNVTSIRDNGWSIILSFIVVDLDNPNSIRNNFEHLINGGGSGDSGQEVGDPSSTTETALATGGASSSPSTTVTSSSNGNSQMPTTSTSTDDDIPAKLVYIEQRLSAALAQTLSDACNARYYLPGSLSPNQVQVTPEEASPIANQNGATLTPPTPATSSYPFPWWPPSTTTSVLDLGGRIASCSGREFLLGSGNENAYASGEWNKLESVPIPRAARDPTNSASSASSIIPNWAIVLGCVAAAILGWAVGMLFTFACCPKFPHVSLKDRLLSDEDEHEQDLSEICLDRMKNSIFCCCIGNDEFEFENENQDNNNKKQTMMKKVNSLSDDGESMMTLDSKLLSSSSGNRFVSSPVRAERTQEDLNQLLNLSASASASSATPQQNNSKRKKGGGGGGGYAVHEEL